MLSEFWLNVFLSQNMLRHCCYEIGVLGQPIMSFPLWLWIVSFKQLFDDDPHDLNTVPDEKQYKISFQRLAYKLTVQECRYTCRLKAVLA